MQNEGFIEKIAVERIWRLFELAENEFAKHPERSKRYVQLAKKIAERNNVQIPKELKANYCKYCSAYLKLGKNAKLRIKGKMLLLTCMECNKTRKMGIK